MVTDVRRGRSMRAVARRFRVCLATVQYWIERSRGRRLDRIDFSDRPSGPREPSNLTPREVQDLVIAVREELKTLSDLGEFGAEAIRRELLDRSLEVVPSVRTIGRILERRGVLDALKRIRRAPPPLGWYLPDVADKRVELDSFDIVEGLVIEGRIGVEVLNAISLHGGLVASFPMSQLTAKLAAEGLITHWREVGLPSYAQFDNDTIFQGAHQHPDVVGRVTRLCLSLGVVPVFAPPRESGFQAAIENYNGRWQSKVWTRFHHDSLLALQERSARYVLAARKRSAPRIDSAPERRRFPTRWRLDLQRHPSGRLVYLRRTSERGSVSLLGRVVHVDPHWTHRLVRAEIDLAEGVIRFYALRRRDPTCQPLLREVPYALPRRRFSE